MNKRLLLDLGKYVLAIGLLVWVVRSNWAPAPTKSVASLAASSVALCGTPTYGPLIAAASVTPDRTEPKGLGYVWRRHVLQGHSIHLGFLVGGFVIYTFSMFLTLARWYLLVRALDLPLTFKNGMRYGLIGVFFNTFLPGAVGGDIIKAAALARSQSRRTAAVATVIMDRLIALWALVWFVAILGSIFWLSGLLTGPAGARSATIVSLALLVVGITASIWLIMGLLPDHRAERFAGRLARLPLVGHSASEFWRAVWMYRRKQRSVALVMLLSWVGQFGFVVAFYCCARTLWSPELGPLPSLIQHFLLVPIGLVMQALVPTPGGAGGGEWGFGALYVLFLAAEANGVLGSLVLRLFSWCLGVVGYLVYVWTRPATSVAPAVDPLPAAPRTAPAALAAPEVG